MIKKVSKKLGRHAKKTVLIMGEGFSEVAFLEHLKSLYVERGSGTSVKIGNARGKGPENVLENTRRQSINGAYDEVVALMDTDIVWSDALKVKARKNKIQLLPSEPCLEGLLLQILNEPVKVSSANLKKIMHPKLSGNSTDRASYEKLFDKAILEKRRAEIPTLNLLITYMQGGK